MYDLAIIGGGPAGYTAALDAVKQGLKVILFEKNFMGGTCLNKGCIPTKSILKCTDFLKSVKSSSEFGIDIDKYVVNWEKIQSRKNTVIEKLRRSLELIFKQQKIEIIGSTAEIIDKNVVLADNIQYNAKNIIIATGAVPNKILNSDILPVLTSDDILNLQELPKSILIVGSGAIGLEWARIFSGLGIEVSIVEMQKNLLPVADIEVSKRIERIFKMQKVKFYVETSVEKIETDGVLLTNGQKISADMILLGVGRKPDLSAIKKIDLSLERNFVRVNSNFQTDFENIFAVGDINGISQLAHSAINQAHQVVKYITESKKVDFQKIYVPSVIYGTPEVAWFGELEQNLESESYTKSVFPVSALGKAHADGEIEGFVKILARNNKIIGAHIISKEASSLLTGLILAAKQNIEMKSLAQIIFAHPTYSEGIMEAIFNLKEN